MARLLTAAVLIPIVALAVYWDIWTLAGLTLLGVAGCALELARALRRAGYPVSLTLGPLLALLLCGGSALRGVFAPDSATLVLTFTLLVALLAAMLHRTAQPTLLAAWGLTFAGACYIGWLLSYYILLRRLDTPLEAGWLALPALHSGAAWVYFVLSVTWAQDTAAYFVGRTWGRVPFAPTISPSKTREGALGGLGGAMLLALLAVPVLGLPIGYGTAAVLGLLGGVAGQIGDLAESWIKRQVGIKDASRMMPGHGGILDRADSMMFAAPVLFYAIVLTTGATL